MNKSYGTTDETRVAEEIVSVLPAGSVARACSVDRNTIRFAVRNDGLKLTTVVLRRASLRRLLADAQRAVKIEYLQRDLLRTASRRAEFIYPRPSQVAGARMAQRPQMPVAVGR